MTSVHRRIGTEARSMSLVTHLRTGARRAIEKAKTLPGMRELRAAHHERIFHEATWQAFHGVYTTLDDARGAIPAGKSSSYDNPASAALYEDRLDRIYPHDYPPMFWMQSLVPHAHSVFDLGGHVGIAYYGYEPYIGPFDHLEWLVCDVPAVVEAGNRLAERRNRPGLAFTSRHEDADGAHILYASGSLQFIVEETLPDLLERLSDRPPHVVLNMMPTTTKPTFFTLNNVGTAICPYRVANEAEFVASMSALGYETVDTWTNPEKRCSIPLHPDHSVEGYRGFYFRRRSSSSRVT